MTSVHRSIVAFAIVFATAIFQLGPARFGLSPSDLAIWLAVPGIVTPLAAALLCARASALSEGADRKAWRNFSIGCALYFLGNLCYVYFGIYEIYAAFPALPELSYFLLAVFFTIGMFQYGAAKHLVSRIQIYNFGLIFCAIAIAGSFLLHSDIASSRLTLLGTVFAFVYPVLWFSVAGFGLVCLLLYAHAGKRLTFTLLLLAILAEASADALYAQGLMAGTFQVGGISSGLWFLSTLLVSWAAVEQMQLGRVGASLRTHVLTLGRRRLAEATVPAAAVAIVLVSAAIAAGVSGYGVLFLVFCLPATTLFAILMGLREHWALAVERELRGAADKSVLELDASRKRLSSVLESTTDSVLVLDHQWRVVFFNRQAADTIGDKLTLGVLMWELFSERVHSSLDPRLRLAAETRSAVDFEQYLPARDIWLEVHAFPEPDGLSIFFRDISEARRIREEVTYLAHHDPLTGLANRTLFQDELGKRLAAGAETTTLFLDLDHFKEVNDTLGHPVGDALLRELADRLRHCVRNSGIVGRIGGDEFAIFQPRTTGGAAAALAQRILDEISAPYTIEGQTVRVGASIGIATFPGDGADPDEIFRNADIALYCAKADGRGRYRSFDYAMADRLQAKQKLKADLGVALAGSQFELAYQPIIDLRSNKVCCFEALLRWHHPVNGTIDPSVFIPIAEEMGLIVPIGRRVLEQACTEAAKWPDGIRIAVNLSPVQFSAGDLPELVTATLASSGLPPERLELEITESVLLLDSEANLLTLQRLRDLGIRIALDDFGTGYASLGYLQKFPFSKIKIDRSFVCGLPEQAESRAIVAAVTGLGRALGIPITAEGVETRQQLDRVRNNECDEAQGYFFNRPVAASDIPDLLEKLGATEKFWGEPNAHRSTVPGYAKLPL